MPDLSVTVYPPTLSTDGKASVIASPLAVGMRINHECSLTPDL